MPQDNLVEVIDVLKGRIEAQRGAIGASERQTRASLIDPLLQALGWDIGDPASVTQEYKADIGIKSNEQVDYALLQDGQPVALLEAKSANTSLNNHSHLSQLYRYFTPSSAKLGILTNGIQYRFYSDVARDNVMDTNPFMQVDITDLSARDKLILACFSKGGFNLEDAIRLSEEETYKTKILDRLASALRNPDESFVSWLMAEILEGGRAQDGRDWFAGLVREALRDFCVENHQTTSTQAKVTTASQNNERMPPSPPLPEGWTKLVDFVAVRGTKPPSVIKFADGQEREISFWNRILIETAEFMISNGSLTKAKCPVPAGWNSKNCTINTEPVHQSGAALREIHRLSNGLYLEKWGAVDTKVKRLQVLLSHCGLDPSQVWLKTG